MPEESAAPCRILVVEDDPEVSEVLESLLRAEGYAVDAIDSATGVAGVIRHTRPDVVLLDLALPFRSGGRLIEALKADPETAGVAVVVVSAIAEALGPRQRALVRAVIRKPFENDRLLAAVAEACGK